MAQPGARGLGDVRIDEGALRALVASPAGPVGRYMARGGEIVAQGAKRRAPVSPAGSGGRRSGHLRSQIGWILDVDFEGIYVDIGSPATTNDGRNAPYGLFQSLPVLMGRTPAGRRYRIKTTPHLQPALEDWPT